MAKNRILFLMDYCLTPHVKTEDAGILCENDRIIAIGGASAFSFSDERLQIVKLENVYAMPGFIDCHVHADYLFSETTSSTPLMAEVEMTRMRQLCQYLAAHGVTAFVPALRTVGKEDFIRNTAHLAEMIRKDFGGAVPVGIHLDGPFINPEILSSHPAEYVSGIDMGYLKELVDAGSGRIKLLSFAPELKNSGKLIEYLLENGIIPSIGHSLANEEQTLLAIEQGARRATDMYNAISPFNYRESNITDTLLTDDRVTVEIIADGSVLSRRAIDLTMRVKPQKNVVAISDTYCNDPAHLDFPALDSGWRNLKNHYALLETDAACCFTSNPAENIGLVSRGELSPGKYADIVFFHTSDDTVHSTYVAGVNVYSSMEQK